MEYDKEIKSVQASDLDQLQNTDKWQNKEPIPNSGLPIPSLISIPVHEAMCNFLALPILVWVKVCSD